jgi:hypothetical protein
MYYLRKLTFVEQQVFTRALLELVDDDAYRKFQNELAANLEKGPVVKGIGGCAKPVWRFQGVEKAEGRGFCIYGFRAMQPLFFT